MKKTKLPTLKQSGTDRVPLYTFIITFVIIISLLIYFAYSLPVTAAIVPAQNNVATATPQKNKAAVVFDATTNIIMRDGKVPARIARKYTLWIYEAAYKHKVDPITILSVMSVESTFKQDAVSGANAIGLMQVIHYWHKEKTTQDGLFDPKNNINVGAKILKEYSRLSDSDAEMLARYNGTWKKSDKYSNKVLMKRTKYKQEIMEAVREV